MIHTFENFSIFLASRAGLVNFLPLITDGLTLVTFGMNGLHEISQNFWYKLNTSSLVISNAHMKRECSITLKFIKGKVDVQRDVKLEGQCHKVKHFGTA